MQAVAAAVAGACLRTYDAAPASGTGRPAGARVAEAARDADDADLSAIIGNLRSKRAAQRRAKRMRKRAAKQAASESPSAPHHSEENDLAWRLLVGSAADQRPEAEGASGAESARALPGLSGDAAPPVQPTGRPSISATPASAAAASAAAAAGVDPHPDETVRSESAFSGHTYGRDTATSHRTLGVSSDRFNKKGRGGGGRPAPPHR